jgi:hypothetical protein
MATLSLSAPVSPPRIATWPEDSMSAREIFWSLNMFAMAAKSHIFMSAIPVIELPIALPFSSPAFQGLTNASTGQDWLLHSLKLKSVVSNSKKVFFMMTSCMFSSGSIEFLLY